MTKASTATAKKRADTQDTSTSTIEKAATSASKQAVAAKAAAQEQARDASKTARKKAKEVTEDAARNVASEAEKAASQMREAGEAFDPNSLAHVATDRIADNLSTAANVVRETDLGSLKRDLTEFARSNPLVFFGGAALLGFAAGRMLKASDRAEDTPAAVPPSRAPVTTASGADPRQGY